MAEGYASLVFTTQEVLDILLDVKNVLMEEHYDPFVIHNNVNEFVDNKIKEITA